MRRIVLAAFAAGLMLGGCAGREVAQQIAPTVVACPHDVPAWSLVAAELTARGAMLAELDDEPLAIFVANYNAQAPRTDYAPAHVYVAIMRNVDPPLVVALVDSAGCILNGGPMALEDFKLFMTKGNI